MFQKDYCLGWIGVAFKSSELQILGRTFWAVLISYLLLTGASYIVGPKLQSYNVISVFATSQEASDSLSAASL